MKTHIKTLGRKLFTLAIELSRKPTASKKEIIERIRAIKGRKALSLETAALNVALARDKIACARNEKRRYIGYPCYEYPHHERARTAGNRAKFFRGDKEAQKSLKLSDERYASPIAQRLRTFLAARLEKRQQEINSAFRFRTADAGDHSQTVCFSDNPAEWGAKGWSEKGDKYSSSCKYSKTDSVLRIVVPSDWLVSVKQTLADRLPWFNVSYNAAFVSLTLATIINSSPEYTEWHYRAQWAEQRRGFAVETVTGWLVIRHRTGSRPWASWDKDLASGIRGLDNQDTTKIAERQAKQDAKDEKLRGSLATLQLIKGGRMTIESLTATDRNSLHRAIQSELDNARKITENFGAMGKRAILV